MEALAIQPQPQAEQVHCPVCGSHDHTPYAHELYRWCSACGSLYQYHDIQPIDDYYHHQELDLAFQRGSYRQYLKILKETLPRDAFSFTLMDVGGGDGSFLDEAAKFFPVVKGTDRSPTAQKMLKEKKYWAEESELACTSPKVVTSFQVIEHVPDPQAFVEGLGLKSGDYLVLTSPAADCATANRQHASGRWRNLSPNHHLCLFSEKSMDVLAEKCGLERCHYSLVWAACHGAFDNLWRHVMQYIKWPVKRLLGRKDPFPPFHGAESFLVILKKK